MKILKSNKWIINFGLCVAAAGLLVSCDDYLDENPDNRAVIDTEEEIISLLGSAYPEAGISVMSELMSDNTDDMSGDPRFLKYDERFYDQVFYWKEVTETDNDGPSLTWEKGYEAAATANQALQSIEELGGATTTKLKEAKGEALLCRAYAHFWLACMFCQAYDSKNAASDLGLPYATKPETTLYSENIERGTMAELYAKIDKDIQEALPLIGDTHYQQPKFHFNTQAALAFAARFYLFYEKWDLAVKYATQCLGSNPKSLLRDWDEQESFGITNDMDPRSQAYVKSSAKCNFMLTPTYSMAGFWFSNYGWVSRFSHNSFISNKETLDCKNDFWDLKNMRCPSLQFIGGNIDKVLVAKLPAMFEMTDVVSQTGYYHSVEIPFKADNLLLERAEAYIMLKQYDKALADLNIWMENYVKKSTPLTLEKIKNYYTRLQYYSITLPTQRRHLNPRFEIDAEGSDQECLLQCLLNFKRLENIHEGMRWQDIKRYGIEICRRMIDSDANLIMLSYDSYMGSDSPYLAVRDPRCAMQVPFKVIAAGFQPNPRGQEAEAKGMTVKIDRLVSVK